MTPLLITLLLVNFIAAPSPRITERKQLNVESISKDRQVDAPGAFSYTAPEGWSVAQVKGLKYKIALTNIGKGFAQNINVVDEEFKGTMDEYVRGNLAQLEKAFPEFKNLGQSAFTTTSGVKGIKLITQAKQQGKLLRQVFYLLRGKNDLKFVITFTALAEEGSKYDAVVDKAIKTFVLK